MYGNRTWVKVEGSSWKGARKGSQGRGVIFYPSGEDPIKRVLTFQDASPSPYLLHSSLCLWCILLFMAIRLMSSIISSLVLAHVLRWLQFPCFFSKTFLQTSLWKKKMVWTFPNLTVVQQVSIWKVKVAKKLKRKARPQISSDKFECLNIE